MTPTPIMSSSFVLRILVPLFIVARCISTPIFSGEQEPIPTEALRQSEYDQNGVQEPQSMHAPDESHPGAVANIQVEGGSSRGGEHVEIRSPDDVPTAETLEEHFEQTGPPHPVEEAERPAEPLQDVTEPPDDNEGARDNGDTEQRQDEQSEQAGTNQQQEQSSEHVHEHAPDSVPQEFPSTEAPQALQSGPIEIRLIDENNTQEHVEAVLPPPPLSPVTPSEDNHVHRSHEETEYSGPTEQHTDTDDKYKKTEYVSDIHMATDSSVNAQESPPVEQQESTIAPEKMRCREDETCEKKEGSNSDEEEEEQVRVTTTMAPVHEEYSTNDSYIDESAKQKIELASMLALEKRRPVGPIPDEVTNDDLPEMEEDEDDEDDDEPDVVEECLKNKEQLSEEIVGKMKTQASRLNKLIRKLNRQQASHCQQPEADDSDRIVHTDKFAQCPIWREEKIVHYYKLMRITYCADYTKWPNAEKIHKTYGQYLPLFETLYAFQKQ